MKVSVRLQLAFQRLQRKYRVGSNRALYQVAALIRREARQSIRRRKRASHPGQPPSAHTSGGLREINFHVRGGTAIIGPRKFPRSNFFNRPVPNIHEKGGFAIYAGYRRTFIARYPERSFMWRAVLTLKRRGKIQRIFNITLKRSW